MKTLGSKHVRELDGLRGIAILLVLIQHQLTPLSISGGFLGVDLFFVLSGFLITSLLLGEFSKTSSISLKNFYMRRLLRLGPALAIYLGACLLVTYWIQTEDLSRQLKLIGLTIFYSTNWRMAFGWNPGFDPSAITWSLSIEEQFYLIWPLLLFGCLALKVRRTYVAGGLLLLILAILVYRYLLLETGVNLIRLYYGSDTRADALSVGCLFGLLHSKNLAFSTHTALKIAGVVSALGLTLLILITEFSNLFLYRGGFTAVALLAGIVIYSTVNAPPRVLSLPLRLAPLVWFGQISYGLYLWHWLIVQHTSFYRLGRWEATAKLALAVGISATSFYFIEKPFNQLKGRYATRPAGPQTPPPEAGSETLAAPVPVVVER